ncbi:MAG: copper amine oxidase N-terminal domain-containing protein [Oscillospiraceae bacterium]|nr:copper amine oxidase N-terminal domain-containing protein [Oscillospiraceae bacterium]
MKSKIKNRLHIKSLIAGIILGVMLFSTTTVVLAATYQAKTATFPIYINGEEWQTDSLIAVIDGRTYLPLRALGDVLSVDVDWNEKLFRVEIDKPEEIYVITEQGGKYHRTNCPTIKLVKEYLAKDKAENLGYEPCGLCQPK